MLQDPQHFNLLACTGAHASLAHKRQHRVLPAHSTLHLIRDTSWAGQHYALPQEAASLYDGDWRLAGVVPAAVSAEGTIPSPRWVMTLLSSRELQCRDPRAQV